MQTICFCKKIGNAEENCNHLDEVFVGETLCPVTEERIRLHFFTRFPLKNKSIRHLLICGMTQLQAQQYSKYSSICTKAETRNTRPPVSLLLCDNLKNRMFLQNFFSDHISGICYFFPVIHIISLFHSQTISLGTVE
jgi:hypothetical protein